MGEQDFWEHREEAQSVVTRVSSIKNVLNPFNGVQAQLEDLDVLAELAEMEGEGSDLLAEADAACEQLIRALDKLELVSFLSGKMDRNSAFFSIHAGAGGTESCDWANMLLRMYMRWSERHGFECELIDSQPGEEAGIKGATVRVVGEFACGYLRAESGVHRLVRISPFDANRRRHTSFAAVDVVPEVDEDIDVEIAEGDLRIDTFRSSGAGGQHVNRTDSAVRITHLPTGTVVTCQNERSQHKNRATALKVLRSRLYELKERKRDEERAAEYGLKEENAWGSQIRSYVLQPYQMVKDLRTEVSTSNVSAVLDGDIDMFIEAYLRQVRPGNR